MRLSPKSSPTPQAFSAHESAVAAEARLKVRYDDLTAEILKREVTEKVEAEDVLSHIANRAAAEAMVRGEPEAKRAKNVLLRDLHIERDTVRLALEIARNNTELARRESAAERFTKSQKELQAVGRSIVLALFELDRALRARDLLVTRIGLPAGTLPMEAWPLAGRLSNTASEAYRFAETGVTNGWISQRELDDEFSDARKSDAWR
jgi:hypothetical protein